MVRQGLRILAFARKIFPENTTALDHAAIASDLTFVGLQGMIDPPRPEAIEAIRKCQTAGIQVKMITGDHPVTAAAIATQIGMKGKIDHVENALQIMTGSELETLSDEALIEKVEDVAVFARVSPEQKLRLVESLQARGHVVAMTGDGVNDAPSVKRPDIGIAMGITGTDVSKEASDMVLSDDNFALERRLRRMVTNRKQDRSQPDNDDHALSIGTMRTILQPSARCAVDS